ncbi:MurR/RpiR family transcriptional regulator [Suttonella ornithocola]|uniref:Als operon repressor n=1 Tax=Suttonella ornithocola TaxID=279832 RepID=A0A380MZE5_9GAMM|nr:MurR/RpiR family transcriptional regulator [Suttonella ornithocola]SUO97594.1 Als operon repressor [Suttonella ornithocola]
MSQSYEKSIIPLIEAKLDSFTKAENIIAQYFIRDCTPNDDLSAKVIANKLNVSEASLTRFAQKCGFKGYRSFAYAYQPPTSPDSEPHIQPILASYQELLNKTYSIVNMSQIHRLAQMITAGKKISIIGKGSSGMVAREMHFRYKRIGIFCEAIVDDDHIRISGALANEDSLMIGISISGQTPIIIDTLKAAKENGAQILLFTANNDKSFSQYCDEVQLIAKKNQLEHGRLISPQFPVLVVLDMLYADIIRKNPMYYDRIWQKTYNAIKG